MKYPQRNTFLYQTFPISVRPNYVIRKHATYSILVILPSRRLIFIVNIAFVVIKFIKRNNWINQIKIINLINLNINHIALQFHLQIKLVK